MHILYLCVVKYDFKRLICDEEKHDIHQNGRQWTHFPGGGHPRAQDGHPPGGLWHGGRAECLLGLAGNLPGRRARPRLRAAGAERTVRRGFVPGHRPVEDQVARVFHRHPRAGGGRGG